MLFNSLEFCIFLALLVPIYWSLGNLRWRQALLFGASLFFYAYWYPPYLFLLIGLVIAAYVYGRLAEQKPKATAVSACIFFLSVLSYYKYTNFFAEKITDIANAMGANAAPPHFKIMLPLGISFIVFQLLGYVIDVSRKKIPAEKNIFFLALFKSYFPQLIAGPINRAGHLIPQLHQQHLFFSRQLGAGLLIFAVGMALKVIFADNFAVPVDKVYANVATASSFESLYASIFYGLQIFGDFWGYSTMAVGMSLMFGITLPINFNAPYNAASLQDFWRRWHITLSTWLRDYLYIPLGGSRGSEFKTYRNLLLTMLLGGFWHGANATFIVWGAIHGGGLALERAFSKTAFYQKHQRGNAFQWIHFAITLVVVFVAWIFFRAKSVGDALQIISRIGGLHFRAPGTILTPSTALIVLAVVFVALTKPVTRLIGRCIENGFDITKAVIISFWLFVLVIVLGSADVPKFIYFDF